MNRNKILRNVVIVVLLLAAVIGGKDYYDMHIKHNFETITEGKVYKSGVIPPNEIKDYVKQYGIKSIIDLRCPGTTDIVNNPENKVEVDAEAAAVAKIPGVQYFNNPSDQVPTQKNLDYFFKIMDDQKNYPVLIHCYHGVGRAEMYSALYRIEYENMDRDEARKKTRMFTKFTAFDLGKPKGDYLHAYESRKQKQIK